MKKMIAGIMAAAMTAAAVPAFSVSAADARTQKDFVLFGDSIAAGVTRDGNVEYNYGDILADYYSGTASNYAVSGDDSDQMLAKIKALSADQKQAVKDAECVVISVGGNDMIYYGCRHMLNFFADNGLLNDGFTKDNIPERPSLTQMKDMIKIEGEGGVREYVSDINKGFLVVDEIRNVGLHLRYDMPDEGYEGYIKNHIMKNISEAAAELKAINPNAKIVVQTVYQPLQISPDFISKSPKLKSYSVVVNQLRVTLEDIMSEFKKQVVAQSKTDGFEVADVLVDFTSQESGVIKSEKNPGHAAYFVDIENDELTEADVHPNQKGHLAIAANIIDVLGEKHDDGGILSDIYENLSDKASYPAAALAKYEAAAGSWTLGDANFDGYIDARDGTKVLTGYAMSSVGKEGFRYKEKIAADLNNDGVSDGRDATIILTYYAMASANKATSFEEFLKNNK